MKQVELDEPMQVSDVHLNLPCGHREVKVTPQWSALLFSIFRYKLKG